MGARRLTAAALGLNEAGQGMLRVAGATGLFQICAVADQDPLRAEKVAAEYACPAYSDFRQLIVQNQLDCLIVGAETHTCDEQIKIAIKKKFHVLKTAPPARTFEQTLEYVRMAENERVQFAVVHPARFRSSYLAARELLSQGCVEHPFLISAGGSFGRADRPAWQSDPELAGGGVLLHDFYGIIDQILWNFPLPGQVYALRTNAAPDKQQRLCLTEDTAVVCMKFNDDLLGNVVATRRSEIGPDRVYLEIHGRNTKLTVTPQEVVLNTRGGQTDQTWSYEENEPTALERLLVAFAQSLRAPNAHPPIVTAAESLRNMAVLESAYLSAKTGFPEEPARILRLAGGLGGAGTSI